MTLRHGEWELSYPGTVYTFGTPETPAWHLTTPSVGDVDLRVADVDRPRQDGRAFGVDYRGGRTISFEMGVRSKERGTVRAEAQKLQLIWRADPVRQTPGAVATLRAMYDGRERVVFGRPRRMALDYGDTSVNQYVGAVADFACVDDLFYAPMEDSVEMALFSRLGGGLLAPLSAPLATTRTSDRSVAINVDTEVPVWPVARIYGPVTNPEIIVGGVMTWQIRANLAYDEWIEVDARPWARYAIRNDGSSVTGLVRGTRLSKSAIPAGAYDVTLRGTDPTGTARATFAWRAAYSTL